MKPRPPAAVALPLAAAAGAGLLMPLQALITSASAAHLGGVLPAGLLSMATALAIMAIASVSIPAARAGWGRVGSVWRNRTVPRWFLLSGLVGSLYIIAQTVSVSTIGLALFAVAVVAARTLSSILIDVIGFSPAGRRPITRQRILGAVLLAAGASIAALGAGGRTGGAEGSGWPVLALAVVSGGLLSFQQSMNGRSGQAYGSTATVTTINYIAGSTGLLLACLAWAAAAGPQSVLPDAAPLWWYYIGGPLGIMMVVTGVTLVPRLGSLLVGIGMVTGQLLGSLLLDVALHPEDVTAAEVLGTLATLLAVFVASWQRGGRPHPRKA